MAGKDVKQSDRKGGRPRGGEDDTLHGHEAYGRDSYSGPAGGAAYPGVGPRSTRGANAEVLHDLAGRLADDPYLDASGVEVGVEGDVVFLDGVVDSDLSKRRAEEAARGAAGVTRVENRLRVGPMGRTTTGPAAVPDAVRDRATERE